VQAAATRAGTAADADLIARTLHAFNTEFDEPTPEPEWLADRLVLLLAHGDTAILLIDAGTSEASIADGLAVMRFRPSLWAAADECYLAELYIRPQLRGQGLGRQLLTEAMRYAYERGATYMDVTTTNQDAAAVALYESVGFDRHERRGPATASYYFEIDLPAPGAA
jgi:ribosomal protein S18 acetylase RimI-like enzyme